ncbi:MAG: hypothetical protein Q8N87_02315 [bacterium]|nr:hypothetical protein [bacterium]
MLIWIATIILASIIIGGWLFFKKNSDRYLYREKAPINFFFRWGNFCHYLFKIVIIILFMITIFSFYKYLFKASNVFALIAALIAGIVLSGGKELLDKYITLDDVIASILGIIIGFLAIILFF